MPSNEQLRRFAIDAGDKACATGRCVSCGRGGFDHKGNDNRVATTFAGQCKTCAMADVYGLETLRREQWAVEAAEVFKDAVTKKALP